MMFHSKVIFQSSLLGVSQYPHSVYSSTVISLRKNLEIGIQIPVYNSISPVICELFLLIGGTRNSTVC